MAEAEKKAAPDFVAAFDLKQGTITQRIADLKRALLAWSSPEQRPGIEGMTETQMISTAFNATGSFIVVAALKLEGKY
jgi:hypothetical protein